MNLFKEWMKDEEYARLSAEEKVKQETALRILEIMEEKKVDRAELARRLGKTRSYITQLFGGKRNMTLKTLSDISHVLGVELKINLETLDKNIIKDKPIPKKALVKELIPPLSVYSTQRFHKKRESF